MDFGCSWPVWISFFFSLSLSHFIDFYANGSPIWTIIFRFDGVDAAIFAYFEIICGRTFFSVLFCVLCESSGGREGSGHYYSDDIRQKIIWWYKSVCIYPFIYEYVLYINVVNLFIVLLRGWHLRICAIIVWDIEWKVLHHHLANECDFFYHCTTQYYMTRWGEKRSRMYEAAYKLHHYSSQRFIYEIKDYRKSISIIYNAYEFIMIFPFPIFHGSFDEIDIFDYYLNEIFMSVYKLDAWDTTYDHQSFSRLILINLLVWLARGQGMLCYSCVPELLFIYYIYILPKTCVHKIVLFARY